MKKHGILLLRALITCLTIKAQTNIRNNIRLYGIRIVNEYSHLNMLTCSGVNMLTC